MYDVIYPLFVTFYCYSLSRFIINYYILLIRFLIRAINLAAIKTIEVSKKNYNTLFLYKSTFVILQFLQL